MRAEAQLGVSSSDVADSITFGVRSVSMVGPAVSFHPLLRVKGTARSYGSAAVVAVVVVVVVVVVAAENAVKARVGLDADGELKGRGERGKRLR